MGFVMGAAFLAVGVFMITPAGGAIVARKNRETGGTGQGYAPKSTQAARVTGVKEAAKHEDLKFHGRGGRTPGL